MGDPIPNCLTDNETMRLKALSKFGDEFHYNEEYIQRKSGIPLKIRQQSQLRIVSKKDKARRRGFQGIYNRGPRKKEDYVIEDFKRIATEWI